MTIEEARKQLEQCNNAITIAVTLLRAHAELMERALDEQSRMESYGHILDPTLFRDPERRATADVLMPLYRASLDFLSAYDRSIEAAKAAWEKRTITPPLVGGVAERSEAGAGDRR